MFTRYNSKIGLEIALPVALILIGTEVLMVVKEAWVGIMIVSIVGALIAYTFKTTYYLLNKDELVVKSGFFVNLNIDANTIKSVKATRNPLSAPAISLDRLEIAYGKYDTVMVSPKYRTGFIAQLLNDHPSIAVELTK